MVAQLPVPVGVTTRRHFQARRVLTGATGILPVAVKGTHWGQDPCGILTAVVEVCGNTGYNWLDLQD